MAYETSRANNFAKLGILAKFNTYDTEACGTIVSREALICFEAFSISHV